MAKLYGKTIKHLWIGQGEDKPPIKCSVLTEEELKALKREVSREIFEEIEKVFRLHTEGGYYLNGAWFPERLDLYTGDAIAELKKKYTEESE